jgi:hypothetical protein
LEQNRRLGSKENKIKERERYISETEGEREDTDLFEKAPLDAQLSMYIV